MLTISKTQLYALARAPREQFIEDMLSHLYSHFPTQAWLLTRDELRSEVGSLIESAATYQLTSRQQVCRFINLAATYGWTFDSDPNLAWMREILIDTLPVHPSERLDRLVNNCLHRQEIERRNLALRKELGLIPSDVPLVFKPQAAVDYSGHESYGNSRAERLDSQRVTRENPSDYRLSRSLFDSRESFLGD